MTKHEWIGKMWLKFSDVGITGLETRIELNNSIRVPKLKAKRTECKALQIPRRGHIVTLYQVIAIGQWT